MGYGYTTAKTFFKIKSGKIVIKNADGTDSEYNYFEGYLRSINYVEKEVEYNGKKIIIKAYNVAFTDTPGDSAEHIWSPMPKSPLFQSFINCILNIDKIQSSLIKLIPYMKGTQQRLMVYVNGQKVDWKYNYDDLPPIKNILGKNGKPLTDPNGNPLWDYSDRLAWIQDKVNDIVTKLNTNEDYESVVNTNHNFDIGF